MVATSRRIRVNRIHPMRLIRQELVQIQPSEWAAIFSTICTAIGGVVFIQGSTWQPAPAKASQSAIIAIPEIVQPKVVAPTKPAVAPKTQPLTASSKEMSEAEVIAYIDKFSVGDIEETLPAKYVGAAEGTRSVDGGKTSLYGSHTDPGNGVNNRGSFSYQFGNAENLSPEESSRRQWKSIVGHIKDTVLPQCRYFGINLTYWELWGAIDLANQAPLAVSEKGGYIERLAEMRKKGAAEKWSEYRVVLEARKWAFWNPDKGAWDASGLRAYDDLGKDVSIGKDQDRRMNMMVQAMQKHEGIAIGGGKDPSPVSFIPTPKVFKQAQGVARTPDRFSRGDRVALPIN